MHQISYLLYLNRRTPLRDFPIFWCSHVIIFYAPLAPHYIYHVWIGEPHYLIFLAFDAATSSSVTHPSLPTTCITMWAVKRSALQNHYKSNCGQVDFYSCSTTWPPPYATADKRIFILPVCFPPTEITSLKLALITSVIQPFACLPYSSRPAYMPHGSWVRAPGLRMAPALWTSGHAHSKTTRSSSVRAIMIWAQDTEHPPK